MDLLRPAVALLALLAAGGAARAQLLSPGPLSEAHAGLEGDDRCGSCHASGRGIDEAGCLGCHADVGERIASRRGLHGGPFLGKPCGACHVEHNGRKVRLVRWPGGAPGRLDHALTGWKLEGAHAALVCARCHDRKNARGAPTYLGLETSCGACHKDPHGGRLGVTCSSCHMTSRWVDVRLETFDHGRTAFPLRGKHATVACARCHGTPARLAGLARTCAGCHEDPHRGQFEGACSSCHDESSWREVPRIRGNHPGLSLGGGHAGVACKACHDRGNDRPPSQGSTCVSCHEPVHTARFGRNCKTCHGAIRWIGLPARVGLEAHGETRFPLTAAHAAVACARCHPTAKPPRERFRGLRFGRCIDCHADPHPGGLAGAARDCSACHGGDGFHPSRVTPALHPSFPLDGKHEAAPCGGCHPGPRPRLDLRQPKRACAECHANPHGSQFAAELAQGGCARCHSTLGWERPRIDHATFPLDGAHGQVACAACHTGATFRGVPRACEGCHADPHAGQFRLSEPARACDACHGTSSFGIAGLDHARLAGFPLEGRHAAAACAACHPTVALRGGASAVRYRLGYRRCRDCHADPHGRPR
jgi:hypothetical protein